MTVKLVVSLAGLGCSSAVIVVVSNGKEFVYSEFDGRLVLEDESRLSPLACGCHRDLRSQKQRT